MRHDHTTDLQATRLKVVEIASTGMKSAGGIILPGSEPAIEISENKTPFLREALKLYQKHYVDVQDGGIAGEGETVDVVMQRLREGDDQVKRVSVLGLLDEMNKVKGIAFIESYEVQAPGDIKPSLAHLCTYAALSPDLENKAERYPVTAAFHAEMIDYLKKIDTDLGYKNSVYIGEVNSTHDFQGNKLSDKMDAEFEIKSGAAAAMRGAYDLRRDGAPRVSPFEGGLYRDSFMLDLSKKAFYVPPELQEGAAGDPAATAAALTNKEFMEGEGEPLFLVTSSAYNTKPTGKDIRLVKDFLEKLYLSVGTENLGIGARQVKAALAHVSDYRNMQNALEEVAQGLDKEQGRNAKSEPLPVRISQGDFSKKSIAERIGQLGKPNQL